MADQQQLDLLLQGVDTWNIWRTHQVEARPNLYKANLSEATLFGANLSGANLSEATLFGANLSSANLSGADLFGTNLSSANLSGANLSGARTRMTMFGNVDLRKVKGLETIKHVGPSNIATNTISRSAGDVPDVFLRGAGLSDTFITYAHSLAQNHIEYY